MLDLACQHEAADVARGDDLPLDLDELHDRRLERSSASSIAASPCALWPKRKFSPTATWVAPRALHEHPSTNVLRRSGEANSASNGMTTISSTPSACDQLGLGVAAG